MTTTCPCFVAHLHCTRASEASANAKIRSNRPPSATGRYTSMPSRVASAVIAVSAIAPL